MQGHVNRFYQWFNMQRRRLGQFCFVVTLSPRLYAFLNNMVWPCIFFGIGWFVLNLLMATTERYAGFWLKCNPQTFGIELAI